MLELELFIAAVLARPFVERHPRSPRHSHILRDGPDEPVVAFLFGGVGHPAPRPGGGEGGGEQGLRDADAWKQHGRVELDVRLQRAALAASQDMRMESRHASRSGTRPQARTVPMSWSQATHTASGVADFSDGPRAGRDRRAETLVVTAVSTSGERPPPWDYHRKRRSTKQQPRRREQHTLTLALFVWLYSISSLPIVLVQQGGLPRPLGGPLPSLLSGWPVSSGASTGARTRTLPLRRFRATATMVAPCTS